MTSAISSNISLVKSKIRPIYKLLALFYIQRLSGQYIVDNSKAYIKAKTSVIVILRLTW